MNIKKIKAALTAILLALPAISIAAPPTAPGLPNQITSVWDVFIKILNFIWPVFIGFAIIMFIVAGFFFLTANGEPGKLSTARTSVIWGIVGVAVGVIAFSIPYIIQKELVGN